MLNIVDSRIVELVLVGFAFPEYVLVFDELPAECCRSVIQLSLIRSILWGRATAPALPVVCGSLAAEFTRYCCPE